MVDTFKEADEKAFKEDLDFGPWRYRVWGYNFEVFDERTEKRYNIYHEEEYAKWWAASLNYTERTNGKS